MNELNKKLKQNNLPLFTTHESNGKIISTKFRDAIQKAIYRMCTIGLIDDFTEDYVKEEFRITTTCKEGVEYLRELRRYYRKYYSEERTYEDTAELEELCLNNSRANLILECLKHLTKFIYNSIEDKRARGIIDMERFCNMAISSNKDWKETNEDLKDYIYYYFNSKYAREGFKTRDSSLGYDVPYSLKDDTDHRLHSEYEITSFELVKKYIRVVDPAIVNNESQKDNVKHLQGAIRLIRRASASVNPVLNLLNIFCIFFLKQQESEMLEKELVTDYCGALEIFQQEGRTNLLKEFTKLLIQYKAISEDDENYLEKIYTSHVLSTHLKEVKSIINRYIDK